MNIKLNKKTLERLKNYAVEYGYYSEENKELNILEEAANDLISESIRLKYKGLVEVYPAQVAEYYLKKSNREFDYKNFYDCLESFEELATADKIISKYNKMFPQELPF